MGILGCPDDHDMAIMLENHLFAALKRKGTIRLSGAKTHGLDKTKMMSDMAGAKLLLLLLSVPFFAWEDHEELLEWARNLKMKGCLIIPVILSPVDLADTRSKDPSLPWYESLNRLPSGGSPVSAWRDKNEALVNVVQGVRQALLG